LDEKATTTYLRAALAVLAASKRPMSARDIVEAAIARGLIRPRGQTPARTMDAELYRYVAQRPDGELIRLSEPNAKGESGRARRGSVRWSLRRSART
jgi:hypothetical protein